MLVSSSIYFIFLALVFLLYWSVANRRAWGLAVLLFANYFFYAKWGLFYLFLIPACSFIDYWIGRGLGHFQKAAARRLLVTASILLNVGILACFKYMPFFLGAWAGLAHTRAPEWHWTFPLGISFYAFQALTYTIDLYRRDGKPVRSLLSYLTAVSFFPTTLSGPITRVLALTPQLETPEKRLADSDAGRAFFLIGLGLLKKFMIADYLAENLVNRIFDTPNLYSGAEVLAGVYGYALQLYYDFSGYTDIAIGSALLLGLKLPANFNMPYAATSVSDFWRRWHISLSNWLRDYLYFSLPGLRSKWKVFPYINLTVTMVIGGLWHGANWTFVLWGLLHGVAQAVNHGWRAWRGNRRSNSRLVRIAAIFVTAHFVVFAWIFFRAPSLAAALLVIERLASLTVSFANLSTPVALVMAVAALAHYTPKRGYEWVRDGFARTPFYVQAAALAALVGAIEYVAVTGATPFVYTRF